MKSDVINRWIAAAACVGLAGCATQSGTAALQCGGGAAVVSYLACKALGKSDKDCAIVAGVSGLAGSAICYSYAQNLEKRRKELAGRENDLDARIKYVRGINEDTVALNGQLTKRVAEVTKATDTLVAQIQAKKVSQQELAKEREARDTEVKNAREQVAKNEEALREVRVYRASLKQPSTDLDEAIKRQQQLYDESQRQVLALAAQRARVG